jgi:hypothetical protein
VTNLAGQFDMTLDQRPAVARRWWILAFMVSFLVLLSTLFFLSEDAYAKPAGKSLEGAVGGDGGGHDGGRKGGDGGGGGDRSPVKEAADAVGGGAQRGGQALKDASGGADRSVGKGAEPVVTSAGRALEPVGAAASPLVEPVAETTRPVVEPVKEVVAPVIEPVGDTAGTVGQALDPVVDPLGDIASPLASSPVGETAAIPLAAPIDTETGTAAVDPGLSEPLAGPSLGQFAKAVEPVAVMPIDEAADIALLPSGEPFGTVSSEGAVLHSKLASAAQGSFEVSSDTSAGSLAGTEQEEASSAKGAEAPVVSETLSSKFLTALQGAAASVEDVPPIQIPQPLGAAGAAAAAGSLSGGSSSDGGTGLGILALVLVSLLGGKSLWSAREFLKPSTTLIPIIERPG